jgi:hypothetical protein
MNKMFSLFALLLLVLSSASFASAEVTTKTAHSEDTGKVYESSPLTGLAIGVTSDQPWWKRTGRNEQRNVTFITTRNETRKLDITTRYNTAVPRFNNSCIEAAVDARDAAVIAAVDSYSSTVKDALNARKTVLDNAWSTTDRSARRSAINAAWDSYRTAVKNAAIDYNRAREAAWKQYGADAKTCKTEVSDDPTNANVDKLIQG